MEEMLLLVNCPDISNLGLLEVAGGSWLGIL